VDLRHSSTNSYSVDNGRERLWKSANFKVFSFGLLVMGFLGFLVFSRLEKRKRIYSCSFFI